jgi:hypothetical protein
MSSPFTQKFMKTVKAVIRYLPGNTHAEKICYGLVDLDFDIIGVKLMSTSRRPQNSTTRNLPFTLISLPRSEKSQEIFKLTNLCYISIKVEAYKSQSGLTTASLSTTCGLTEISLPVFCGVEATTCIGNAQKRARTIQHLPAGIVNWWKGGNHTRPIQRLQPREG